MAVKQAYPGPVAVIGAGMAGMACAEALTQSGLAAEIFEKARDIGGRLSARPVGDTAADIGAQYATARGPDFRARIDRLCRTGDAVRWQPKVHDIRLDDDGVIERRDPWLVGAPAMSALAAPQSRPKAIHYRSRVTAIGRTLEGWRLTLSTDAVAGPFAAVAVTAPAPQTLALTAALDPAFEAIGEVGMSPCWTLVCVFERPVGADADVVRPSRNALTWAARNGAKPGRDGSVECWVIHGDPVWSLDHLEEDPAFIQQALLEAFARVIGSKLPPMVATKVHRWRYARVEAGIGQPHLFGGDGSLGVAGDWCIGPRVEAAFDSGRSLGLALADRLRARHPEID